METKGSSYERETEKHHGKRKVEPAYWFDDVFIDQGFCWVIQRREKDNGHYDLVPLCLGKQSEIVPILKGDKPIPEDMNPRRRVILIQILGGEKEHERVSKPAIRATRLQRVRLIRNPRHIKRGT